MSRAVFLIYPLFMTLASECLIAMIIGLKGRRCFCTVIAMNLVTNPLLNIMLQLLISRTGIKGALLYVMIFILETVVVLSETLMLRAFAGKLPLKPLWISVILNLSSLSAGLLAEFFNRIWKMLT